MESQKRAQRRLPFAEHTRVEVEQHRGISTSTTRAGCWKCLWMSRFIFVLARIHHFVHPRARICFVRFTRAIGGEVCLWRFKNSSQLPGQPAPSIWFWSAACRRREPVVCGIARMARAVVGVRKI